MKKSAALLAAFLLLCGFFMQGQAEEGDTPAALGIPTAEPALSLSLEDLCPALAGKSPTPAVREPLGEGLYALRLEADRPGPSVLIVAGIHGDETAGMEAAALLSGIGLSRGRLTIVSPANPRGAARYARSFDGHDMNRSFPGDPMGDDCSRAADALFQAIRKENPDLVLDLHESRPSAVSDTLGNALICDDTALIGEVLFSLLADTQTGAACSAPFSIFGGAPAGSLNYAVRVCLHLPVVTVETDRDQPLATRVSDQLTVIRAFLSFCEML